MGQIRIEHNEGSLPGVAIVAEWFSRIWASRAGLCEWAVLLAYPSISNFGLLCDGILASWCCVSCLVDVRSTRAMLFRNVSFVRSWPRVLRLAQSTPAYPP